MKIAALSSFPPRKCGIAYLTENLFDEFKARGHELVKFGIEGSDSDHAVDTRSFLGLWKAAAAIKRQKIEYITVQYIISFYGKRYFGLNFLLFLVALRGKRVIVTLHEVHSIRSFGQIFRKPADLVHILIEGLIARLASGVILLTETQARDLKRYGARETKTIYLGILPKTVSRTRTGLNEALFFGKLLPAKGVHLFAGIARACPHIHFTIACSVETRHEAYRDELARAFADIPNIEFICKDWIGDEEKEAYFTAADVLVLPYINTFYQSGVAAESGVYNIPNIITRLGPLSEITERFNIGVAVDDPSPESIKAALESVFANYSAHLAGIQGYRNEANWKSVAAKYLDYLRG